MIQPGQLPQELLHVLKQGPGRHVKMHTYTYVPSHKVDMEHARIQRVLQLQQRAVALLGSLILALLIGVANQLWVVECRSALSR